RRPARPRASKEAGTMEKAQGRVEAKARIHARIRRKVKGTAGRPRLAANKTAAVKVGALIAERAHAKGISAVVFDRGGHLYHGNVKALAEAAREKGLKF